jgi:hypothetical protein
VKKTEAIMLLKGGVISSSIFQRSKWFGIEICQLCDSKGYAYNMLVYLSKDKNFVTATVTATYAMMTELTTRIENMGHKLCMDNFFFF